MYGLSVFLCLIVPYIFFLTSNTYWIFSLEVLPTYFVALAIGAAIVALVSLHLLILARLILWVCLIFTIAFLYELNSIVWVAVVAVASAMLILSLRDNAAIVVLIAATMHIGSTIGLEFLRSVTSSQEVSKVQPPHANGKSLPPVLHLVLDEFAGIRGFPIELTASREVTSQLSEYYSVLGFDLYSHAYSQYIDTTESISNLVNFSSSATYHKHTKGAVDVYRIDENRYFKFLLDAGYSLYVYQSSYLDFCNTTGIIIQSCTSYESNSIADIEDVDIDTNQKARFIVNSYIDSSAFMFQLRKSYLRFRDWAGISLPSWPTGNSRTGPLSVLPIITELKTAMRTLGPGEVHFAHLMLPHYPYILDANCSVKPIVSTWLNRTPFEVTGKTGTQNSTDSRAERYIQYLDQIRCTQRIVRDFIEAIKSGGHWEDSIIIIHGDHGSRIVRHFPSPPFQHEHLEDDFRDAYSTFFAVKNDASAGKLFTSKLALQTLLARAWSLPAPHLELQTVYTHTSGQTRLAPISLLGFDPIDNNSPQIEKR